MAEEVICPHCGESFASAVKMKNHIQKSQESKHQLMNILYKELKLKCADIIPFSQKYNPHFSTVTNENLEVTKANILNDIAKEKEAVEEAKRQKAIEKQEQLLQEIEEAKALKNKEKEYKNAFFNSLPKEDKPQSLIDEFYSIRNEKCYNYIVELKLVQGLFLKNKFNANQIRTIMKYMTLMGKTDLRSINYFITDAFLYDKYWKQVNEVGTSAYYVKMFYTGLGIKCNKRNFLKEVKCIDSTRIAETLTTAQTESIIKGMIHERITVLMWFSNYVTKYRYHNVENACHNYSEEREINEVVNQIMEAKICIDQITDRLRTKCKKIIEQKFINGEFNKNYNHLEWAFKVHFNLNSKLLDIAEHSQRPSRFECLMSKVTDDEKASKLAYQMGKFNEWLKNQPTDKNEMAGI